jgi:general secretion pathway protein D
MTPQREFRRGALFFLLLALAPVFGQQTPSPDASTPGSAGGFSNFQNTPISSLLDTYEQVSGKHLIRDVTLAGLPPITLNATGVGRVEFLKLVESTLLLNGIAIVPVDERTAKVVNIASNKNPRSEGVRLYANAEDIPKDDSIVSYYMPLNYLSPTEAVGIFAAQAPVHVYGAYIPAPTAQAVVLTEGADVIRELIALKELIDVPPARVVSEFVQLTRADAEKTADLLNKLLDNKKDSQPVAGAPIGVPPNLGNNAPLSNERDLISGPAEIVADTRSNRILIVTRPVNLPFLRQMIMELDRPNNFMQPERRPLKYVLAEDILPALEGALAQGKEEEDQAKQSAASATSNANSANNNPVQTSQAPSSSPQNGSGTQSSPGNNEQALTDPAQNNVPTVVTIGKTRILADNRSNSIIVFGSPDAVNRVFDMIDQLDRKPLQVYIASVIGQLTVSEGVEFGIDILQKFQHVGSYGLATGVINTANGTTAANVPEPAGLISSTGFPLLTGLNLYGAIGNTIDAYVRALETTNRFKVISRPSVYTMNNKAALIASGSQVPVPASTTSGFTSGTDGLVTTSSVAYENVLLQLSIVPVINANHQVTLRIRQSNDSIGGSQTISGNAIPIINTQKIDTEVTVPDKSTIVIGGLISDTTERDTSGIPWLSDIPVLGYLFKDTKKSKTRSELIIMISPTVVETEADQVLANESEKARTILGREAENTATQTTPPEGGAVTTETTTQVRGSALQPSGTVAPVSQTTTVIRSSPISPTRSLVPAASTPAPDVSKGKLPKDAPPVASPAPLP